MYLVTPGNKNRCAVLNHSKAIPWVTLNQGGLGGSNICMIRFMTLDKRKCNYGATLGYNHSGGSQNLSEVYF